MTRLIRKVDRADTIPEERRIRRIIIATNRKHNYYYTNGSIHDNYIVISKLIIIIDGILYVKVWIFYYTLIWLILILTYTYHNYLCEIKTGLKYGKNKNQDQVKSWSLLFYARCYFFTFAPLYNLYNVRCNHYLILCLSFLHN